MQRKTVHKRLLEAIEPPVLCRIFWKYDLGYYSYIFPRLVSDRLVLGMTEHNFLLDGFTIKSLRDITLVEYKDDKCAEILAAEGVLSQLYTPELDLSDWKYTFASLQQLEKPVMVEYLDSEDHQQLALGYIHQVLSKKVRLTCFDADGIWLQEPLDIPYSRIMSVDFNCRYVEVFSKYLPTPPKKS